MNCLDKMKTLSVVTHILLVISMVNCDPCSRLESLDISNGSILANGSIEHDGIVYNSDTWYQVEEEGQLKRLGCPCIGRICLWKCCGTGRAYFNRVCNDTDMSQVSPFNPPLYLGTQPVLESANERFFYMSNSLCEDKYLVDENNSMEQLYIQKNATLYEISSAGHLWHSPATYCVDMMVDNDTSEVPRMVAAVCFPETEDDTSGLYIAYAVGLLLSVPFLLATFLVYAMFSELRNVHGMCLMAYCLGLIVAYPFLAFLKINAGDIAIVKSSCFSIAFIIYYAFQTSFFWLNVMCFDIWRTFSGYRGGSTNKRRERRRFVLYGLYAWGVPLLLTACTIFMQFNDDIPESFIRPGFGNTRCWFDNWLSELVYFFVPVLCLVACNLVLFSVTAHRIRSIKQETAILKSSESARSDKLSRDKQRYVLYLKLFVVMGINWTVELISFVVGGSNWYWAIVDLSNIMLGFFIFIIFVWKNKVRNLIMKKIRGARAGRAAESSTGRWATRSSSAPTDDTRISSTDDALRLRDMDK